MTGGYSLTACEMNLHCRKRNATTAFFMKRQLVFGLTLAFTMMICGVNAAQKTPLFNGKDLQGWKESGSPNAKWQMGIAALDAAEPTRLKIAGSGTDLVACEKAPNLTSEEEFGDCILEFEFMLSKNSNSGVKLMKIYEIQILDSYGKDKVTASDCGAVYLLSPPRVNASRKPGEWQKMLIEFHAPRFDGAGKKIANAKFTRVLLNGQIVQENFDVPHGTNQAKTAKEFPQGALYIQGDHGPVSFRNVNITRLD